MTFRSGRHRPGWVVVAAATALTAAGGSAVGLGAPAWLAGGVAAVSALAAGNVVDRVFHARDTLLPQRQRRTEVLDVLRENAPKDGDDALGLLRAGRSPLPYRGRRRELTRLALWCSDNSAAPVFMISGSAGVGKSRLALEFASRLPQEWPTGWLRRGMGEIAVGGVRACGDPTVILVDDANGRADLPAMLDAVAGHHTAPGPEWSS